MRIVSYMAGVGALFLLPFLAACTDEYEYAVPEAGNGGIFFGKNETTEWVFGPDDVQTFSFNVTRHDSVEAHTYKLVASDNGLNIPSEVSFAAGESCVSVTATANLAKATFRRSVTITAGDGDAYIYGNPELNLTLSVACNKYVCEKEIYASDFSKEPCTVYDFGTKDVDGKAVTQYGARDFLCDGYMFMFTLDADGKAKVEMQDALYAVPYIDGVTDKYLQAVEGTGFMASASKVEFNLYYYIDGMNIYSIEGESITFPTSCNPVPNSEPID